MKGDEETGQSGSTSTTSGSDHDENEILSRRYRASINSSSSGFGDLHMLTSYRPGESKIERMAKKIEERISERVEVTFNARREFLKHCRRIAVSKGYPKISRVHYSDILEWRMEVHKEAADYDAEGIFSRMIHFCGILSDTQCLDTILTKAKVVADKIQLAPDDEFHYEDFNHHHTVLVSRWPWMRYELLFALGIVLTFYFLTPILFCLIMGDDGVCPQDAKVPGWVSALYFASTTMSTVGEYTVPPDAVASSCTTISMMNAIPDVLTIRFSFVFQKGYGDLSVEKDKPWKVFIGVLYMIASVLVALLAFSAAAESKFHPLHPETLLANTIQCLTI